MTPVMVYVLTIILLPPQIALPNQANSTAPVEIGFNCCQFYKLDSGTPVFMQGEEIWLKAEQDLAAVLRNSNEAFVSKSMLANSAMRLYLFREEDPSGLWELEIRSQGTDLRIPLYLVRPEVDVSLAPLTYAFKGGQLALSGTLEITNPHQGGVLLLKRQDELASLEMASAPFHVGLLLFRLSWDRGNPRSLSVAPYAPALTSSNMSRVWAEVSLETPLLKQVGTTQVFTIIPQTVMRTTRETINVKSEPNQTLKIDLPNLHQVGPGGQVPLRLGSLRLNVFLEMQNVIYTSTNVLFLLTDGIVGSTASSLIMSPEMKPVSFELVDDLEKLSTYKLVLFAKMAGATAVWSQNIVPPVTRIRVLNTLTDQPIDDYEIASDQILETAKVESNTFVIPRDPGVYAELALSIGGVKLQPSEFNPQSTRLEPLSLIRLRTSASTVQLRVTDALGTTPSSGRLQLSRIAGENAIASLERSWKAVNGMINLTLPLGDYKIELTIDGSVATRQFSASNPTEIVTINLNEIVLVESRNQLILTGIVSSIILVEVLVALRLWRSLGIRRRMNLSR